MASPDSLPCLHISEALIQSILVDIAIQRLKHVDKRTRTRDLQISRGNKGASVASYLSVGKILMLVQIKSGGGYAKSGTRKSGVQRSEDLGVLFPGKEMLGFNRDFWQ